MKRRSARMRGEARDRGRFLNIDWWHAAADVSRPAAPHMVHLVGCIRITGSWKAEDEHQRAQGMTAATFAIMALPHMEHQCSRCHGTCQNSALLYFFILVIVVILVITFPWHRRFQETVILLEPKQNAHVVSYMPICRLPSHLKPHCPCLVWKE